MIIVRLKGGMGNQMFQYALGRTLSLRRNVPLSLDVTFLNHRIEMPHILRPHFIFRNFDLDVFNIEASIAQPSDISFWNRPFFGGQLMLVIDAILRKLAFLPGWEKSFRFDKRVLELGPDTYLEGFWQSEKYFSEVASIIRKDFTLKDPLSAQSRLLSKEIKNTESLCIHVRRTDYILNSFSKVHGQDYYDRALAFIVGKHPIKKIYVFSDDIEWCKTNLKFSLPTMFVGSEYAGHKQREHFALMSACKHFIIPNSTFSWWAAWLSDNPDKIVVAPKQWLRSGIIDATDIILESWVQL